jgi:hypothetical protein
MKMKLLILNDYLLEYNDQYHPVFCTKVLPSQCKLADLGHLIRIIEFYYK